MAGDDIVITTTGKSAYEGEVRKISSVSADQRTLTLNETLTHRHAGKTLETVTSKGLSLALN